MFHRPHVERGLEILDAEQRRDLGQARSRHRGVFQARRSHADSVPADSGQHRRRGASAAAGDPGAVHARRRRAAVAGGARGVLRSAATRSSPPAASSSWCRSTPSPAGRPRVSSRRSRCRGRCDRAAGEDRTGLPPHRFTAAAISESVCHATAPRWACRPLRMATQQQWPSQASRTATVLRLSLSPRQLC